IEAVAFGPRGGLVLTIRDRKTLQLWDITTGRHIGEPMTYESPSSGYFSPDGRTLLVDSFKRWELRDTSNVNPVARPIQTDASASRRRFSPDSRILMLTFEKEARLWDARTARPIGAPIAFRDRNEHVAVSPDGRTLLTGARGLVRRWELATGRPM